MKPELASRPRASVNPGLNGFSILACLFLVLAATPSAARAGLPVGESPGLAGERLGKVSFAVSCKPSVLLASDRPREALIEYKQALLLSPSRFNGLYNAGMAAEAIGDKAQVQNFYSALLKSTGDGSHSVRPEFQHMKEFAAR